MTKYITVIGLEVHAELKTKTKAFCSCSTAFGSLPNTHVCPVCLGMPGALPVLNKQVVDFAIKAGLALNCDIQKYNKFDRKTTSILTCPRTIRFPNLINLSALAVISTSLLTASINASVLPVSTWKRMQAS